MSLTVEEVSVDTPDVARLIAAHIAASRLHYDVEDCHTLDGAAMAETDTRLFAAIEEGQVLAIAGLKPIGPVAVELKSMFADEAARGRGIAKRLLAQVPERARDMGAREVFLEAGTDAYAAPARALYKAAGFETTPPFGTYVAREASTFMRLGL